MFYLALKNLKRHKLRTTITIIAITIAVFLVSTILFAMFSLKKAMLESFAQDFRPEEIVVVGFNKEFGADIIDKIRKLPHVTEAVPVLSFNALVLDKNNNPIEPIRVLAVQPNNFVFERYVKESIAKGLVDKIIGEKFTGEVAIISLYTKDLAKTDKGEKIRFELKPENIITDAVLKKSAGDMNIPSFKAEFAVIGFLPHTTRVNDEAYHALIPLKTAETLLKTELGKETIGYPKIYVKVDSIDHVEETANKIREIIHETGAQDLEEGSINAPVASGFTIITGKEVIDSIKKALLVMSVTLIVIASVSGVVAGLGIINTMIMSVYEQRKDIGILKALGATRWQVFRLYLYQGLIIGLIGGAIGMLLSVGILKAADPLVVKWLAEAGDMAVERFFVVDLLVVAVIAAFSALLGVLGAVFPALKAASVDPVEALRE